MERQHIAQEGTRGAISRRKRVAYVLVSVGAVTLVSVLVFLFFPDPFINTFLKGRITDAFREAYPAYAIDIGSIHYSIRENRIGFDSVALTTRDSSLTCTIAAYSVSGIGWFELLWARGLVPSGFTGTVLDAQGIVATFPREQYELRCGLLRASVPDSQIVVDTVALHPLGDDEQFFAASKFRRTRFRLAVPHARVVGLACLELLQGKMYRTRSAHIRDPLIDVLINKDKPAARDSASPPMPNELLAMVEQAIDIDSIGISNGALHYSERFVSGSTPALLSFDSMQVAVRGITNQGTARDTTVIHARGRFVKSGVMSVRMSIPASSPEFSLQYAGSLGGMDLRKLNVWLETSDHMRIKSGVLQTATFDIMVDRGRARGNVRAVYRNLSIASIDGHTRSEEGISDLVTSFLANTFKIRGTNLPAKSGAMEIGVVHYTRKRTDPFFGFVWFALRSGVGDVVGF